MAKNRGEQRLRLRVTGTDDIDTGKKSGQKILKYYFDLYEEPELSFGMPAGKGGEDYDPNEPVAILANGEVVGFLDERDRFLFEENVDNAIRGYVNIKKTDSEEEHYEAEAVIVLNQIITMKEKRKNELTRKAVIYTAVSALAAITAYDIVKGYWLECIFSAVLLSFVVYVGLIRKPPKKKSFYRLP